MTSSGVSVVVLKKAVCESIEGYEEKNAVQLRRALPHL